MSACCQCRQLFPKGLIPRGWHWQHVAFDLIGFQRICWLRLSTSRQCACHKATSLLLVECCILCWLLSATKLFSIKSTKNKQVINTMSQQTIATATYLVLCSARKKKTTIYFSSWERIQISFVLSICTQVMAKSSTQILDLCQCQVTVIFLGLCQQCI